MTEELKVERTLAIALSITQYSFQSAIVFFSFLPCLKGIGLIRLCKVRQQQQKKFLLMYRKSVEVFAEFFSKRLTERV